MAAKHMNAMQLLGIKRQFLPKSDIFATMAVRLLNDVPPCEAREPLQSCQTQVFPAHNPVRVSAINAGVPSKGGLTTLAFNCDSQQINNVIIVK